MLGFHKPCIHCRRPPGGVKGWCRRGASTTRSGGWPATRCTRWRTRSIRHGFCWIKAMCSELIHCWYKSFFWELFTQYFICIYAAVCKVPHFYILFLICVPIVFCNHRDNNISNYSVSCFQVLFLMYHYFTATEIYNAIRVFIAAYVWMTGFGNFSYYYTKKDFSLARFAQVSILISGPVCSVHG
jgi:hypothetical protein